MYKLCIAGSRGFTDYQLAEDILKQFAQKYLNPEDELCIISGGAKGADRLGEDLANNYGLYLERYIPDWDRYGKSAGYRRNVEMAENSDAIIVFWNGISKGTKHMIDICKKQNKLLWVIRPTIEIFN